MIVFYSFILAMNCLVLLNSQITLHNMLKRIENKRTVCRGIIYSFMVITSYILFPIGVSQGVLSFILIIVTYFYVGGIFYGLHPSSPLIAFTVAFVLQCIGFMLRLSLGLEITPALSSLILFNGITYLFMVPLFITLIYLMVPTFLKMEHKSYTQIKKKM